MNKNKYWIIISVSLSVFIIFFTWVWFTSNGPIPVGKNLTKSDWLLFWGSFLSFIATSTLGIIALSINIRLDKTNKELTRQNAVSEFYSEIRPVSIELSNEKMPPSTNKTSNDYAQFIKIDSIENKKENNWLFFLNFSKTRVSIPTLFRINTIRIVDDSDKKASEDLINIITFEQEFFHFIYRGVNDLLSMPVCIDFGDGVILSKIKKSESLTIEIRYTYMNPFKIVTNSHTYILLNHNKENKNQTKEHFSVLESFNLEFNCCYMEDN